MNYMKFLKYGLSFLSLMCLLYITGQSQADEKQSASVAINQVNYGISGRVIDESGTPIEGVRVYSLAADHPPRGRTYMSYTDKDGKFSLSGVEAGKNDVLTAKESDGYADTLNSISVTTAPISVIVDEAHPQAEVEIRLGKKSPRLVGNVIEAMTNKSIKDANVRICLVEKPEQCFSTSIDEDGTFNLLAPLTPFTVKVSSPTHKESKLTLSKDSGKAIETFILNPGEEKKLTVTLEAN